MYSQSYELGGDSSLGSGNAYFHLHPVKLLEPLAELFPRGGQRASITVTTLGMGRHPACGAWWAKMSADPCLKWQASQCI